jgi:hypothetical protein
MSRKTTPTYVLLNQITLAATSSSVTFSNIPQGYGDLVVSFSGSTNASEQYFLRVNGDTGSNYSWVQMGSDSFSGTFSGSATTTGVRIGYFATSSARDDAQTSVLDYSATDKHKSVLVRTNSNANAVRAIAGRWANTAAVTSVTVTFPSGSFSIGSTFFLYGVYA